MCWLAVAGLTGIYLHQRRQVGMLSLVGYLIFVAAAPCSASAQSL